MEQEKNDAYKEKRQINIGMIARNKVEELNMLYDEKIGASSIDSRNFKNLFSEILKEDVWDFRFSTIKESKKTIQEEYYGALIKITTNEEDTIEKIILVNNIMLNKTYYEELYKLLKKLPKSSYSISYDYVTIQN